MKRIQNLKRTIALFLAMLMAATSTAFADWDSFQGNDDNNGTSTYGVTSTSPSTTTVPLPNNGATTGLDVEPLVYGSRIYAFHNGGSNGATVTAVSATNGSQLWTTRSPRRSLLRMARPCMVYRPMDMTPRQRTLRTLPSPLVGKKPGVSRSRSRTPIVTCRLPLVSPIRSGRQIPVPL